MGAFLDRLVEIGNAISAAQNPRRDVPRTALYRGLARPHGRCAIDTGGPYPLVDVFSCEYKGDWFYKSMWDGQFCPIGSVDNLEENPNRLLQMQQLLTEGVSKLLTTGDARPERGGWLLALAELNWPRAKAPEIDWVGLRQSYLRGDLGDHPRLVRLPFAGRWRSDGGTGNSGGSSDHKVVGYCPSCGILTVSRTMELWGNSHKAWREGGDEKERLNRLLYEGTPLLCRLCQQASWQLAPKGEVPPPDAAPPHIAGEGWHIRNFTRYA